MPIINYMCTHTYTTTAEYTHCIKTAMGISKWTIKWHPSVLHTVTVVGVLHNLGNIYGICQDGGGSPVYWLVVLLV